ncbi:hypothetical protein [Streptomyces violascens]|uniref:Uncharacterized protein n=1 Tax=Streptomyces violascens TaxID=67381 RepID=A0ABQ3QMA4_9ACTN|nr:hypothetical protein [Streptomyces violascens]GGT99244.1 hypothetical protein GCM10010289_19630 [Streptomyces violascens]GHI38407.1 hypothetical protein Sviol_28150 [Streptomyces violascens]
MDTNPQGLAGRLRKRGLHVDVGPTDAESLRAANPLDGMLTEQIAANGNRYVTSVGFEIGEPGLEASCAERIAHPLAIPVQTGPREHTP